MLILHCRIDTRDLMSHRTIVYCNDLDFNDDSFLKTVNPISPQGMSVHSDVLLDGDSSESTLVEEVFKIYFFEYKCEETQKHRRLETEGMPGKQTFWTFLTPNTRQEEIPKDTIQSGRMDPYQN
ncbi:hypothetical protein QYM36_005207 [Artemia franciscana]|uniref:Uncharacterized protein n=1 Tax=Artemia franciscana TaxID=6661 RepID=A0AA88I4G5_ARTSF|nr:hypothetical protein QYM36_005207 [Artemia franciscana]